MIFCAVCRLTFCWRWCIMKIRPAACASGPSKRALCILTKKRGALPLLGPAHIQKFKQIFILVWECDRISAVLCQMFGVNIPPHALDNFNRGGFAVGVHKFKPYGLFHSFSPFCLSAQSRAERTSSRFTFVGSIDSPKCHPSRTFLLSSIRTAGASATRRIQSALVLP